MLIYIKMKSAKKKIISLLQAESENKNNKY